MGSSCRDLTQAGLLIISQPRVLTSAKGQENRLLTAPPPVGTASTGSGKVPVVVFKKRNKPQF